MADGRIRWNRSDYSRLGKAISRFNKKVESLSSRNLPKVRSYEEIKGEITTRRELNRIINSLNRFLIDGAEEIERLPSGEKISRWEKKEIGLELRIAKANIRRQMKPFEEVVKGSGGFTRAQMGSTEYRELQRLQKNFDFAFTKQGKEFARVKSQIEYFGTADFEMKRAIIYRNSYMEALREYYSNLDGFDELMKRLNRFSNPISFYKFLKSKGELAVDFAFQYDLSTSQAYFDRYLRAIGI